MRRISKWKVARNLFIVIMCVTAAVVVSAGISDRTTPRYSSSAHLLIAPNGDLYEGRDLLTAIDTLDRTSVLATYVEVFNSARIQQGAATQLGIPVGPDAPYEVSSLVMPGASVIEITAEGTDAKTAAALANDVVARGIVYLQPLFAMYRIDVLDPAAPAIEPFAPNRLQSALVAGALAAGLGVLLASLLGWSVPVEPVTRSRAHVARGPSAPVLKR